MPQVIVLDTHIWFWWITQDVQRFPKRWPEIIETAEQVAVSPVSCYEIALAHRRGNIMLPCEARDWLHQALAPSGIELFPITAAIAARAVNLSPIHKDPFDRLIIATALEHQALLASVDGLFMRYTELQSLLLPP
ncbi:MAG: PIN domain-containing protein [Methylococcaceae bacterium]|nr:PIN domain-containing protein [Methylococcaceae bacterium]